MAATLIQLADALVVDLNAATLSQPFSATRGYAPVVELPALDHVFVTVIPQRVTITAATRQDSFYECAVDIGVQRLVNPDDRNALDALMQLVEEIGDHLRFRRLTHFPAAAWQALENAPVFAAEHLTQHHQFTSVLTLTYRVRR